MTNRATTNRKEPLELWIPRIRGSQPNPGIVARTQDMNEFQVRELLRNGLQKY